jgi:pyruvate dehydrogenase E2 component (dihydrolipoamide acetyltransferase)
VTELTMPKLTDSMEEGTILTWLKAAGERVQEGEDLLEIESDKATVTHHAEAAGILEILASEGTTLPVGATIARLGVAGKAPSAVSASQGNRAQRVETIGLRVATHRNDVAPATDTDVRATPLARRVAAANGIRLEEVAGSGPLGRITRRDVLSEAGVAPEAPPVRARPSQTVASAQAVGAHASNPAEKGTAEIVEPTRRQSLIARRMAEANATIPHFQVQTEVAMNTAIAFREQIKHVSSSAPSVNDLIVKAAALALREHPLANGSYRDGHFEIYPRVNIGVAVAADDALVVPTISDADEKTLGTIAAESKRLAERVRGGQLSPGELSGATFTVSNLGMYGMTAITPVINPPQAAILGVGAIRAVLARADGEIVDRQLLTLTLSCDHRILNGTHAAGFLSTIRGLLEQPIKLTL